MSPCSAPARSPCRQRASENFSSANLVSAAPMRGGAAPSTSWERKKEYEASCSTALQAFRRKAHRAGEVFTRQACVQALQYPPPDLECVSKATKWKNYLVRAQSSPGRFDGLPVVTAPCSAISPLRILRFARGRPPWPPRRRRPRRGPRPPFSAQRATFLPKGVLPTDKLFGRKATAKAVSAPSARGRCAVAPHTRDASLAVRCHAQILYL